jgi:hypothetical protein
VSQPRYCDQCARSLVPLDVPHVIRQCESCAKTIHVAEPGESGAGIRVRKGDRFTIPAGWLTVSLDPAKSRGRLARPGISWIVRTVLMDSAPRSVDDLPALLDRWEAEADKALEDSERLQDLDLSDERGGKAAVERFQDQQDTVEWWALMTDGCAQEAKRRLEQDDPGEAALWAVRAATAWSMLVFHRDLEEHVWTGYKHNAAIYGIARASAQTPAEAESIDAVRPIFEGLREDLLHAWVESGVDIGPRIGVTSVDEKLLKALAKFHLSQFERRRKDRQQGRENRARTWTLVLGGFGAGAAVTTASVALLNALGVL